MHGPLSLHPSEPESEWNLLMVGAGGVRVADEGRVRGWGCQEDTETDNWGIKSLSAGLGI